MSQIPDVEIKSAKRSLRERASVVWLVPLAALAIALGVAWQSFTDQGPLIEIRFDNASGVTRNETELRYRDVAVGIVETVKFTEDLDQVILGVRLDKDVAPFVDDQSQFWVVRPEVTTQGVSGLDTVLSGVYLEGDWDERPSDLVFDFEGLSEPPLLARGQQGLTITMRSSAGSLSGNTPILYKGVEVGRVGPANVSNDGFSVEAQAVVFAPYDNLVTNQTRFWDTSGFSLSIGTTGASVDFESLASLIAGGVTFDTFVSGAQLARDGATFNVFGDSGEARASIFDRTDGPKLDLVAIFDGNVAGLTVGAAVELNGLRIGEVTGLNGIIEDTPSGANRVRLQTVLSIQPSRLGLDGESNAADALAFLVEQVDQGLRARLITGSILTGGLKVQLLSAGVPNTARLDTTAQPFPIIPVTDSELVDMQSTAQGALDRLNNLPIEELLQGATDFLNNASVLIGSPETQAVPGDVSAMLAEIRNVVGSPAVQGLPDQLAGVMTELESTIVEVRQILEAVEEQDIMARAGSAVDAATALTTALENTVSGVPALLSEIEALAAKANSLPLEALVAEVASVASSANALLGSDATLALPAELTAALAELRGVLVSVNGNDAVVRLLAAVDAAALAADTVGASVEGVPALIDNLNAVAADAQGLELDVLIERVTSLVSSADTLVSAPGTQTLPDELNASLAELRRLMAELNEGGAIENTNAALLSARNAADEIAAAADSLPGLIARANTLLEQANTTLSGFEGTSPAIRDARAAMQEVARAAEAVSSLARAIERRPNSLLVGR